MPRRCIAAGCNTVSGEGYSLHEFPCDDAMRSKWTRAVKLQRVGWKGPTSASLLCSKHFEPDCFITGGVRYRDAVGIPAKKCLRVCCSKQIATKPSPNRKAASCWHIIQPIAEYTILNRVTPVLVSQWGFANLPVIAWLRDLHVYVVPVNAHQYWDFKTVCSLAW